MASKKASRRRFLKGGVAAAAAVAMKPVTGQTPPPAPVRRALKDEVAYGERSKYVTSCVWLWPRGRRPIGSMARRGHFQRNHSQDPMVHISGWKRNSAGSRHTNRPSC